VLVRTSSCIRGGDDAVDLAYARCDVSNEIVGFRLFCARRTCILTSVPPVPLPMLPFRTLLAVSVR
jgi:hypothetical protein